MRAWGVSDISVADAAFELGKQCAVLWQGRAIQAGATLVAAYFFSGDFMSVFKSSASTLNPPSPTFKRVVAPTNQDPINDCVKVINIKLADLLKIAKEHNKLDSNATIEVTRDGEGFKISTHNSIVLGYSLHCLLRTYGLVARDWEGETQFVVNLGALQQFEKALQAFTQSYNKLSGFWKQLTGIAVPANTIAFLEKSRKELFPNGIPNAVQQVSEDAKFILFDQISIALPNSDYKTFVKGRIELVYRKLSEIGFDQYLREELLSSDNLREFFEDKAGQLRSFGGAVREFQDLIRKREEHQIEHSVKTPQTPGHHLRLLRNFADLNELYTLNQPYFVMLTKIYRALAGEEKENCEFDKSREMIKCVLPLPPLDERLHFSLHVSVGSDKHVTFKPYFEAGSSAEYMRQTYLDRLTEYIKV